MTILLLLAAFLFPAPDATLAGNWITPDTSVVKVYPCQSGQLCVRILTIGQKNVPHVDANNPDSSQRNRTLCGLTIGTAFTPDGSAQAKGGKIYDPKSGKTYSAQMESQGDELKLHGYIGVSILGRTETWHRAAETVPVCS